MRALVPRTHWSHTWHCQRKGAGCRYEPRTWCRYRPRRPQQPTPGRLQYERSGMKTASMQRGHESDFREIRTDPLTDAILSTFECQGLERQAAVYVSTP